MYNYAFRNGISLTFYALQPRILAQHSVRMKPTTITNQTEPWILTRNVTLMIKALSQTWTWRTMPRFYPYC